MASEGAELRIGEFARRAGVNPELLRAWERRYGVLKPVRSAGGFRLYTDDDLARVRRMRRALDSGLSAAEAARVALAADESGAAGLGHAAERLFAAVEDYDEGGAHAVIDEILAAFGLETLLREVVLPALAQVGDAWAEGKLTVSQEHFASNLVRGRLIALARTWGRGGGPLALLACAPGEAHDITLVSFGLVLRSYGWRILFLGASTPVATVAEAARTMHPSLTIVSSFDQSLLKPDVSGLRKLARIAPLLLAGPGASEEFCARLGFDRLDGDLISAASEIGRGGLASSHA